MHHRFPPSAEPTTAEVKYIDYAREAVVTNMHLAAFFDKRLSFSHEQEVRYVVQQLPLIPATWAADGSVAGSNFDQRAVSPPGEHFTGDLQRLIKAARVAPQAPAAWIRELTAAIPRRFNLDQLAESSALDQRPIY